jgi:hypothetical protein
MPVGFNTCVAAAVVTRSPQRCLFACITPLLPSPVHLAAELSLGAEFQRCATRAQNRNKARKKNSLLNLRLNDYRQVYFSREDRKAIPAALIEEIK